MSGSAEYMSYRASFPTARLGDANDVSPKQTDGNGLPLNGARVRVFELFDRPMHGLRDRRALVPIANGHRGLPAPHHDVEVLPEDTPVALVHLRQRLVPPVLPLESDGRRLEPLVARLLGLLELRLVQPKGLITRLNHYQRQKRKRGRVETYRSTATRRRARSRSRISDWVKEPS